MLSWIEIDKARLTANINALRALNSPGTALMVVIKANAYGHGLETVAPVVAEHADWFGVNCIDEALALTRLGIQKPIAILGHTPAVGIEQIVQNGYRQALYRLDVAKALSVAGQKHASTAHIHLKIETGTNRQGIALSELQKFAEEIMRLPRLEIEGVYTHFANIEDTLDPSFAQSQFGRFREALATLERPGVLPGPVHATATPGRALIHGLPASVVGRVAMNMTMFDVTDIGADLDDEVVLIGRQGNGEIRAEELAEKIGTIPYEVLARINPLIPRVLR